jgi:hypothetical protein
MPNPVCLGWTACMCASRPLSRQTSLDKMCEPYILYVEDKLVGKTACAPLVDFSQFIKE